MEENHGTMEIAPIKKPCSEHVLEEVLPLLAEPGRPCMQTLQSSQKYKQPHMNILSQTLLITLPAKAQPDSAVDTVTASAAASITIHAVSHSRFESSCGCYP
jgi:hypothetical protein